MLIIMVSWTCSLLLEVGRSWEKRVETESSKSVSHFIEAKEHSQAQTQDLLLKETGKKKGNERSQLVSCVFGIGLVCVTLI